MKYIFAFLPIRLQLILLAVLLTLPALGIITYSGLKIRAEDSRAATVESQKLADNLAAEVEHLVDEALQLESLLADLDDVRNVNAAKVQALLEKTIRRYPQYNGILITDAAGIVWAATYPSLPGKSIAGRRYFRSARASGKFSSGEFVIGNVTGLPTIHLAYPIMVKGSFQGVVAVGFKLETLRTILERSQLPPSSNYIVTDHRGIIIGRGKNSGAPVGTPMQAADLDRMQQGPDRDTYIFSLAGEQRVVTYRKVRIAGEREPFIYVRASLSTKDSVAKANRSLIHNVAILLPFVVVAFGFAVFIGKRSIVDPVRKLQAAADSLSRGNLDTRVESAGGGELGLLARAFDDMARKLAEYVREKQQAAEEYQAIIRTTSDGFSICDSSGRFLMANSAYCAMVGYTGEELLAMNIRDLEAMETGEMVDEHLRKIRESGSDSFISRLRRRDGGIIDVEITVTYLDIIGGRYYGFVRDITDRKKLEEELWKSATYDRLTGVFNRQALEDRIEAELSRARRYGHPFSLIMLDIDDFKGINDTHGHQMGDRVLRQIGKTLLGEVRVVDSIGRWGGEEFIIILPQTRVQEAALVAEKLHVALKSVNVEGIAVTASFGVASMMPEDTLDSMLKRVDDLLYRAKGRGKNRLELQVDNEEPQPRDLTRKSQPIG